MVSPASDVLYSSSITIPGSGSMEKRMNALAGPSSEGAINRRASRGDTPSPTISPSSAPPTPSVISVTHPSPFIHTHHPRRGSMTPLGLNLISPVSPFVARESAMARQMGFSPHYASEPATAPSAYMGRRGSAASTTSTLTQSRPLQQPQAQQLVYPPNWNPGRRRSSLTPSLPTLAAASPTKAHVVGRPSRPTSSEGNPPAVRPRTRTAEHSTERSDTSPSRSAVDSHGRRGSMPHLGHGRYPGAHTKWNPVLAPPRGSVGDDGHLVDGGFKFGSGPNAVAGPSAAAAALRAVDHSPHSRASSIRRRASRDAFEQAEDDEADRQRRAFLAATYGDDGRRARERLSIGGVSGVSGSPGTPGMTLRRQSLMLWERMGMASMTGSEDTSPVSAPTNIPPVLLAPALGADDLGQRRGSLPMAIPGGGLGRSVSRRSAREQNMDAPPAVVRSDATPPDETEEEFSSDDDDGSNNLSAPTRPLPPLLPLSDPGPRLLPSTLALHRANHLLTSRNLQSEPLPHPLPPSLHPPAPVDVAEFDIDFILSGSSAQLGQGKKAARNGFPDGTHGTDSPAVPPTPTLRLGADEEDTFAKFVGEFDDEYGGRRGEWTFRACGTSTQVIERSPRDPLDASESARPLPRAEWESSGAGKYEIFANGEVRSVATGRSWRISKLGSREYELEEVKLGLLHAAADDRRSLNFGGDLYCLADKAVHRDQGGVKIPHLSTGSWMSSGRSTSSATSSKSDGKPRGSFSDGPVNERTARLDSEDSAMTMTPQKAQSVPVANSLFANKKSLSNHNESERGRYKDEKKDDKRNQKIRRSSSKEPESENKKDRSLGGVLKRGILQSFKSSSLGGSHSADEKRMAREERERERQQAHTWAGASINHASWSHGIKPIDREFARAPAPERSASTSAHTDSTRSAESASSDESRGVPWYTSNQGKKAPSDRKLSSDDDMANGRRLKWREGIAWKGIPDDAVALIVPLKSESSSQRPPLVSPGRGPIAHPFFTDGPAQALLVWYVPFNSEGDEPEHRPSTATSRASMSDSAPQQQSLTPAPATHGSGSLPKFQKLLRRRASKDKEALKRETASVQQSPAKPSWPAQTSSLQPLPFRSFRVVARVVDTDELRSDLESSIASGSASTNGSTSTTPFDQWQTDQNPFGGSSSSCHLPHGTGQSHLSPVDEAAFGAPSAAKSEANGRNFPTVIAVCHSRSQGVEFVLEGLDRLGFCKGESAWGPTGYEEWRGTGLSEQGRSLLDLLWAGCTGVMGLSAQ